MLLHPPSRGVYCLNIFFTHIGKTPKNLEHQTRYIVISFISQSNPWCFAGDEGMNPLLSYYNYSITIYLKVHSLIPFWASVRFSPSDSFFPTKSRLQVSRLRAASWHLPVLGSSSERGSATQSHRLPRERFPRRNRDGGFPAKQHRRMFLRGENHAWVIQVGGAYTVALSLSTQRRSAALSMPW